MWCLPSAYSMYTYRDMMVTARAREKEAAAKYSSRSSCLLHTFKKVVFKLLSTVLLAVSADSPLL